MLVVIMMIYVGYDVPNEYNGTIIPLLVNDVVLGPYILNQFVASFDICNCTL